MNLAKFQFLLGILLHLRKARRQWEATRSFFGKEAFHKWSQGGIFASSTFHEFLGVFFRNVPKKTMNHNVFVVEGKVLCPKIQDEIQRGLAETLYANG